MSILARIWLNSDLIVIKHDANIFKLFDVAESQIIGQSIEDLFSAVDRKSLHSLHESIVSYTDGVIDIGVAGWVLSDKKIFVRMRLFKDTNDDWEINLENIHDGANRYVKDLVQSSRIWHKIFGLSYDGLAVIDHHKRLYEYNESFVQHMKFRSNLGVLLNEGSIRNADFSKLRYEDEFKTLRQVIENIHLGKVLEWHDCISFGKRMIDIAATGVKLIDDTHLSVVLVCRDVTTQRELEELRVQSAQASGMSEVSTGIIHNIGNVINSLGISLESQIAIHSQKTVKNIAEAVLLLKNNKDRLTEYVISDNKGKLVIDYLEKAAEKFNVESAQTLNEFKEMLNRVGVITEIIRAQQQYAKGVIYFEKGRVDTVVEEVLSLQSKTLRKHDIEVTVECSFKEDIQLQKNKLVHILFNLIANSKDALQKQVGKKQITIRIDSDSNAVKLEFEDNGDGINPDHLSRIFAHGFTTKSKGHGFGLHFCSNAMKEMGGNLVVFSQGIGHGTRFTLSWPVTKADSI